jgi:hypothetical protein
MKTHFFRSIFGAVLGLVLACSSYAADFVAPVQKIVGAEQAYAAGELIDLTISPIKDKPQYFIQASYDWKVFEENFQEKRVRPYGDGILFGSGLKERKLKAVCIATYLYAVKDGDKISEFGTRTSFLIADVIVGSPPEPDPGPGPGPKPPQPDPTFDAGKYDLAKWSYQAAKTGVPANATRAKVAQALATKMNGIAASIAAGTLKDAGDILQKTHDANLSALKDAGGNRDDWVSFFTQLQNHIYDDLYAKKLINSADDFATAWREISAGLSKVQ